MAYKTEITVAGDMADEIALREFGAESDVLAFYAVNPHMIAHGPVFKSGLHYQVPLTAEAPAVVPVNQVRLW